MRQYFNPRSPMEILQYPIIFQSTLPAWGATFNLKRFSLGNIISIHAPRMGSDAMTFMPSTCSLIFQSTPPHGERLCCLAKEHTIISISIHAPRMGSDTARSFLLAAANHFNPRSRMGSDTSVSFLSVDRDLFQSTLPHGERRRYRHRGAWYLRISIHAPRMGSDT